jgi:carbon monoxide dehydrogenase subunit G
MRVEGERRAAAAPAELWRSLSDPRALGEALPNVDLVDVEGDDRFSASVRFATGVGITPLRMRFAVSDRREGEHVRITGSGHGGDHAVDLDVELDLAAAGSGSAVRWRADVRVLGPLRSLGQRALPGLVRDQVDAVLAAAEREAGGSGHTEAVAGAGAGREQVADPERYQGGGM